LLTAGPVAASEKAAESRLDEVQRRGAQVMPFSLEQTTHIFTKTATGGIQQVIAKEKSNAEQIGLIQVHLAEIARQFAQGDYSAPAKVHGEDMPGLRALRAAKPGQIRIEFKELIDGAQIDYSAENPRLIEAIHQWFDAQLRDHARHAVPGHDHDQTHGR
jgi:hypothetical protein